MNYKFVVSIDKVMKLIQKKKTNKLMKDVKFEENESYESFNSTQSHCSFNENNQDFKQIMLTDTPDKYYIYKKKKLIFS